MLQNLSQDVICSVDNDKYFTEHRKSVVTVVFSCVPFCLRSPGPFERCVGDSSHTRIFTNKHKVSPKNARSFYAPPHPLRSYKIQLELKNHPSF